MKCKFDRDVIPLSPSEEHLSTVCVLVAVCLSFIKRDIYLVLFITFYEYKC